jgi:pimeloyl-ACP methyl ester carboxylesterase
VRAPEPRAFRVEAGGGAVAGVELGAGPPLVLLHGLAGTSRYWEAAMRLLAGRARCVALDLPGFGGSDAPPGGFALDGAADRLAAALTELVAGRAAAVCGHSLGGPVAVRLALRHPPLVSRLVLVAPSGLRRAPAWQRTAVGIVPVYRVLRRLPLRWERLLPVAVRRTLLAPLVGDPSQLDPGTTLRLLEGARSARELAAAVDVSFSVGLAGDVARVRAPIAAAWGERDHMVAPEEAEFLLRAAPVTTFRILPGCGHMPMVERPEAFAALLAELADLPSTGVE